MDWQSAFNVAISVLGILAGWILRALWGALRELQKDLTALREHIPQAYVSKLDLDCFKSELFRRLERIEQKLDVKADK